jgi:hypothetical protein
MLLAIPYQGFASATMMLCADAPAATTAGGHDHAAMLAHADDGGHDSDHGAHGAHGKATHEGMKCGGAACCAASMLAPAFALRLPPPDAGSEAIPFSSCFLPTVDLAHPERPPQAGRA